MKKWMIALMMAALLIVPMGGIAYAVGEGAPAAPAAGEFIPGDVPAQSGTMDAMVAPVNALVMCMVEQGLAYNDQDDVFLWNSLYYMLSLCGQMDERAELTDDMLILPAETVADYAGALFSNFDGLPALPREMNGRVSYDWQNDTFRLARGDAGLTETRLGEITELGGGRVQVAGALVSLEDESVLCSFTVDLVRNNSMFGYAISGLDILSAPGFFPGRRYEMGRICLYWKRYLAILGSAYYNRPCSRRRRRRILKNWGEVLET